MHDRRKKELRLLSFSALKKSVNIFRQHHLTDLPLIALVNMLYIKVIFFTFNEGRRYLRPTYPIPVSYHAFNHNKNQL